MTPEPQERSENYNMTPPQGEWPEVPPELNEGLDFLAEERVNPEDVTGGTPKMSNLESRLKTPAPSPSIADLGTEAETVTLTSPEGLEHLFSPARQSRANPLLARASEAVVYLRVSTPRQLHTAADLDEDGNSIATQRVEALRKTRELRATVVREFVEPGQSAQTITKRPEFKKLLRYLDDHPNVDYVVIYMRSRVFRNFTDAAITKRQLLEKGVRLISAKEEFGEGYMADAMEAITDVMNEVQVRMNGEDVKVKMAHKVEQGGSVGRAKLGYLNVRKDYGGRLVNTIDVDESRAPLVAWGFEQYATGQYSISQLRALLEEQGLTTRASPSHPERPISNSRLAGILRDPYYTGVIRYRGTLHAGRHQPLISKETFLQVQEILDRRNRLGDRDIIHFHYLKGMLLCGACHDEGRVSRLIYSQNTGNGGTYEYFICTAKQRGLCSMPAVRVDQIEAKLAAVVEAEQVEAESIDAIRGLITATIDDMLLADRELKSQLRRQLKKLEAQEERLLDLAADATMPIAKVRAKLQETTLKKAAVSEQLQTTEDRLKYGSEKALAYIDLLREPGRLYRQSPDTARRDLLAALFSELLVYVDECELTTSGERTRANSMVRDIRDHHVDGEQAQSKANNENPRVQTGVSTSERSGSSSLVRGLSKTYLAGVPGLEPRTKESESSVLPITPYPNGSIFSFACSANAKRCFAPADCLL